MNVDYVIIGQGICGTFLSYYLMRGNRTVYVIDEYKSNTASRVASGVINPVTGRRIVKTWKIDVLMPFANMAYNEISTFLKINNVIQSKTILDIHATKQMQHAFEKRLHSQEQDYINACKNEIFWKKYFEFELGIGEISPAYSIDLTALLNNFRNQLVLSGCLSEEHFNENKLQLKTDSVIYKNIHAKKIIFCDGINAAQTNYFKHLPFALNKGEVLHVSIPDLPPTNIYKQGFSIIPLKGDLFWIGSVYDWNFENDAPTHDFKMRVKHYLDHFLKVPFSIKDHYAALRPANTERRPFVGLHTIYSQIGILNGMGTKGCSLAPYYANQLAQHLINDTPIDSEADIQRFATQ